MATTLSQAQYDTLTAAVELYTVGTAPENQLHVDLVDRIAKVAVDTGFSPTVGQFHEDARNRPLTTLLSFAAYLGKP